MQLNEQLPAPVPQTKKFPIAFTQCNNKSKLRCRLQTSQVAFQPLRRPAFLSIRKNKNELGPKPILQKARAVFAKGPLHGRGRIHGLAPQWAQKLRVPTAMQILFNIYGRPASMNVGHENACLFCMFFVF